MSQKAYDFPEKIVGRDALFRAFLNREPTKEEIQRLDRTGKLMGIPDDDSLWYNVIIGETYDDRLGKRLADIDRVAQGAAAKALELIAEAVVQKADELAAKKDNGATLRSWLLLMGLLVLVCAPIFNAGYIMGSGDAPLWVHQGSGFQRILSWLFNVPSGWILLLGSAPLIFDVYKKSFAQISDIERFGISDWYGKTMLYLKIFACLISLGFTGASVLYLLLLG